MPRLLNKIKDAQTEVASINTNFDRISLDIADRSGTFSSVATVNGLSIAPTTVRSIEVNVVDSLAIYTVNKLPVIPRIQIYIGTDANDNFLWPSGGSLTTTQIYDIQCSIIQSRQVFNSSTNEKATYFVYIKNSSASVTYTLYIYLDAYYVPAPDEGVTKRATDT